MGLLNGVCLICANAHYGNRKSEWIGYNGRFFCDLGARGLSSCLPKFDDGYPNEPSPADRSLAQNQSMSAIQEKEKETEKRKEKDNECLVTPGLHLETMQVSEPRTILEGLKMQGQAVIVSEDLTANTYSINHYHTNYANYLFKCWSTHAGLVIRPSDIWFVVSNELAKHINNPINAEIYRCHFSDAKPGAAKEKLIFIVNNPDLLDIDMIINKLKGKVKI